MKIFAPLNSEPHPSLQEIEVATFFQLPSFHIIGLPCPEVAEARERIRSAIDASDLEFPRKRVVLNLSPASIRKRGTGLDLAMALGILTIGHRSQTRVGAWGELGLDGSVKPAGQLTRSIYAAWLNSLSHLFIAQGEMQEALKSLQWIRESGEIKTPPPILIPVNSLKEAWELIQEEKFLTAVSPRTSEEKQPKGVLNFNQLLPLSSSLERITGIATAGNHHVLLLGPRGAGKSHALEWLIAIQLPPSPQNRLQQILLKELRPIPIDDFPVRRISSQVKPSALLGGATSQSIRPGEFSLAHGGLLIADELPEWARDSRESLREPLERGKVTLTRAQGSLELPAQFLLAANGNFCPCGGWPHHLPVPQEPEPGEPKVQKCRCPFSVRKNYLSKLSGPLLDRIDLVAIVTPSTQNQIKSKSILHKVEELQEKVRKTQEKLKSLWGKPAGLLTGAEIEDILQNSLSESAQIPVLPQMSLRSRHKIARLALSFAAWDGADRPAPAHWMEASCYRPERFLFED